MKLSGEIARFKVFPNRRHSACYWTVLVFSDKGGMRRAFRRLNVLDDTDDRFGATVMPQEMQRRVGGKWKSDPSLGYALFACTQLDVETQCHEAVHLATGFLRRLGQCPRLRKETDDIEETLAYCIGRCARQLNNGFHKYQCYR